MPLKIKKTDDVETRKLIEDGLKQNDGYCPCRVNKTPETKCMCAEFRAQETEGPCHCGLYIKTAN